MRLKLKHLLTHTFGRLLKQRSAAILLQKQVISDARSVVRSLAMLEVLLLSRWPDRRLASTTFLYSFQPQAVLANLFGLTELLRFDPTKWTIVSVRKTLSLDVPSPFSCQRACLLSLGFVFRNHCNSHVGDLPQACARSFLPLRAFFMPSRLSSFYSVPWS